MGVLPSLAVKGLGGLEAAFTRGAAQADLAARANVQVAAAELIKEAQANFHGEHKKNEKHVGPVGGFPNVVTGTLRRSIQSDGIRAEAPGLYATRVGPSTKYGRRVELGLAPTNPYPYFGPAVKRMRLRAGTLAASNWARIVRF